MAALPFDVVIVSVLSLPRPEPVLYTRFFLPSRCIGTELHIKLTAFRML